MFQVHPIDKNFTTAHCQDAYKWLPVNGNHAARL